MTTQDTRPELAETESVDDDELERMLGAAYETIAERDKRIEELEGRHSLHHVPTLKRVMEAHTEMPVGAWEIGQHWGGHRDYRQAADESCYLCVLAILLEKSETKNVWLREALDTFRECNRFAAVILEPCAKCDAALDATKGENRE